MLNWTFDFWRAGPRRAFAMTREMFRDRIEKQLPQVKAPTLVLHGGIDPTVPQSAALTAARLLRRSKLVVIPGEPHCVHYTDPLAVWQAWIDFLGRAEKQEDLTRSSPVA